MSDSTETALLRGDLIPVDFIANKQSEGNFIPIDLEVLFTKLRENLTPEIVVMLDDLENGNIASEFISVHMLNISDAMIEEGMTSQEANLVIAMSDPLHYLNDSLMAVIIDGLKDSYAAQGLDVNTLGATRDPLFTTDDYWRFYVDLKLYMDGKISIDEIDPLDTNPFHFEMLSPELIRALNKATDGIPLSRTELELIADFFGVTIEQLGQVQAYESEDEIEGYSLDDFVFDVSGFPINSETIGILLLLLLLFMGASFKSRLSR